MNRINKFCVYIFSYALIGIMLLISSSCSKKQIVYDSNAQEPEEYSLVPYSVSKSDSYTYEDKGTEEKLVDTFTSADGLCLIRKFNSYYDVTLDYENGSASQIGKAYAECIEKALPDFAKVSEPYLYENINLAYHGNSFESKSLQRKVESLINNLPEEYKEEIFAFAEYMSKGMHGFIQDGIFSYEEILTFQVIPEALRGTCCSALSLWGDKTYSGKPITVRVLEWSMGSECRMGAINAVVHHKKGEASFTAISFLGLHGIISAINDNGVFSAILDVGSDVSQTSDFTNKRCYTYDIRYALEQYDTAKRVGNFLCDNSYDYTFCHNVIITDKNYSACAENCVREVVEKGKGFSVLRTSDTPLFYGLSWEDKNSFCVVNSFATRDNQDKFSVEPSNIVRFDKYKTLVNSKEKFSLGDLKTAITSENVDDTAIMKIHSQNTIQIIIVDYETGHIQVAFTGTDGVKNRPAFIDIGTY